MKLMRRTDQYLRRTLELDSLGVVIRHERPKAGGGWYTASASIVPWPWKKS